MEEEYPRGDKADSIVVDTNMNTAIIISELSETDTACHHRVMVPCCAFKDFLPEFPPDSVVREPTNDWPYDQSTSYNEKNDFHALMISYSI
jgi:hypothetical protein